MVSSSSAVKLCLVVGYLVKLFFINLKDKKYIFFSLSIWVNVQHKFLPKKLDIITISIRNFALIILELDKCPLDKCPTTSHITPSHLNVLEYLIHPTVFARHPQRQVVQAEQLYTCNTPQMLLSWKMSQPTFDLSRVSLANDLCNNILQN